MLATKRLWLFLGTLVAVAAFAVPALAGGGGEPLVVRGADTVAEGGCAAGVCTAEIVDGTFRGSPVGAGAYTGDLRLEVAAAFPNGEGGVCAPASAELVLGAGTPDRLVLALDGISCQDGAGNPTQSSFTTQLTFKVKKGTGSYAHARGSGVATFLEGADDHDRMTLTGTIKR